MGRFSSKSPSAFGIGAGAGGDGSAVSSVRPEGPWSRGRLHHFAFVGFPSFMLSPQPAAARPVGDGRGSSNSATAPGCLP